MGAQAIAAMIIAAVMAAGAGVVYGVLPGLKNGNALEELVILAKAGSEAGFYLGKGNVTSFSDLALNGYLDDKIYTTGVAQNEYGNDMTATSSSSTGVVTMTYQTDADDECLYLLSQIDSKVSNFAVTPSCNTTTFTMQLSPIRG
jgi:hypothetical protein